MTTWDWILLSGIPSSHPGGTGQMMRHLESEVLAARRFDGTIMYSPDGESLTEDQLQLLTEASKVILFHPQMLGVAEVLRLIELRRRARRVTSMYLLDSFFFCRRSYNHIDQEWTPCLRCIGTNRSHEADRMGCSPWPKVSPGASEFAIRIGELVSAGAVSLIAQTETQRELAHRHFGQSAAIGVAGLWCEDWQEHFDHFESFGVDREQDGTFDVVYHGSRDLAKGLGWVLTVAAAYAANFDVYPFVFELNGSRHANDEILRRRQTSDGFFTNVLYPYFAINPANPMFDRLMLVLQKPENPCDLGHRISG